MACLISECEVDINMISFEAVDVDKYYGAKAISMQELKEAVSEWESRRFVWLKMVATGCVTDWKNYIIEHLKVGQ